MRLFIILVSLVLVVPSSAATWMGYGTFEPDTTKDIPSFMWFDTPGQGISPVDAVYFNGFQTEGLISLGQNPNLGATQSRVEPSGLNSWGAMLGKWTDCNGDGYVGIAETAATEYSSAVLDAAGLARCPDGTAHNNDGWVTEMLMIGNNYYNNVAPHYEHDRDPRMIVDDNVVVWGDTGLPTDAHTLGSGSCAIFVVSKGGAHETGGILNHADCLAGGRLGRTYNALIVGGTLASVLNTPVSSPGIDPSNSNGLALTNPNNWQQKNHPLNQPTFGNDQADPTKGSCASGQDGAPADPNDPNSHATCDHSLTHVQDCTAAPINKGASDQVDDILLANQPDAMKSGLGGALWVTIEGPFAKGPSRFDVARPLPSSPSVNPPQPGASNPGTWGGGNVPGTVNMTNQEVNGDCDYYNDGGDPVYGQVESQSNDANTPRGKTEATYLFNFSAQFRGDLPTPGFALNTTTFQEVTVGGSPTPLDPTTIPLLSLYPQSTPNCLGVTLYSQACFQTIWRADNTELVGKTPTFGRVDLNSGSVQPADPAFTTFYAFVSSGVGALPSGDAQYALSPTQCVTSGAGQHQQHGWECDPAVWYTNTDGTVKTIFDHIARPGQHYNLRDVDCYDGQVVQGVPVWAGSGELGPQC